jgi:hypothetical protein
MRAPNLFTFIGSIFSAIVYWWKFERFIATERTRRIRNAICVTCPFYKWGQCQKCTCVVSLKIQLSAEECPLEKWGPEE